MRRPAETGHERPTQPAWLRGVGLGVVALVFSAFAWWPALMAYPNAQGGDGGFFHQMIEAMRASVVRYHELPLWNPYQCGGVPLWDNPQGIAAAPLVWPLMLFDTTRAIELWYVVHSAIGFVCMWILARHELRLSRAAAMVASVAFAFCGVQNQHLTGGHFVWVPYLYYPLALFLWRRAERDMRMAVGLGILVAVTMAEGGTYPLPHLALLLGAETLTRAWPPKRLVTIARAGAVVVAVGLTLGACRFFPLFDQLRSHTRPLGVEHDALQWQTLKDMFLSRDHGRYVAGQEYVWPEFGDYVGPLLLATALLGVALAGLENAWLVALLLFAIALMMGHAGTWAPWAILKGHVYPFKQMRVPSRFNATVTVFLAAFAGIAVDRVSALARRVVRDRRLAEATRTTVIAIALVGAGDMIGVGVTWCSQCFNGAPQTAHVDPSPRLYLGGPGLAQFIDEPAQNRGRFECWEEWAFMQGAALWAGDEPQAKAADDGAKVQNVTRTQNTFAFDVDASRPARILLDDTYDHGWRATVGDVVESDKLLAVDVPPGWHHVVVKYWPRGLTLGFTLSALSLAGIVAFYVLDARRRRAAR